MPEPMIRKQIYLPRRQNLMLKRLAKQRGISEAEIIRQALDREAEVTTFAARDRDAAWNDITRYVLERKTKYTREGAPLQWDRQELYEERENRRLASKPGK